MPDTSPISDELPTEADAVANIVRAHIRPEILKIAGQEGQTETEILILPDANGGLRPHSVKNFLDEYRDKPERRKGVANLTDLDSLIAHVNRFKDPDSALFVLDKPDNAAIHAVLDYHPAGASSDPRFGAHRARYDFPLSEEWKIWSGVNAKSMDLATFAEFLEDRILDVMTPPDFLTDPANAPDKPKTESDQRLIDLVGKIGGKVCGPGRLMELAKGLRVHDQQTVKQAVNLSSGEGQIRFESEHRDADGKPINVPNLFLIAIPVFDKGALYRIPVRLRYRLSGGRIEWTLLMHRPDMAWTHALTEACDRAAAETDLPLFYGQPEN